MIVLSGIAGQFNDWSRTVKHLPTAVEHEMVVSSDEGKDDRERSAKTFKSYLMPLPPRETLAKICSLVKGSTITQDSTTRPEPPMKLEDCANETNSSFKE